MSGAILQPPCRPDADWGVVFIEVTGCLPMCGHGAIGVATALVECGMVEVVEPLTVVRLDTPAGLVPVEVEVSGGRARAARLRNVASFVLRADAKVDVRGRGQVGVDVAYGGNFYALVPAAALDLTVDPRRHDELVAAGLELMDAVNEQLELVHPTQPWIGGCRHVVLTRDGGEDRDGHPVDGRAAVVIHPGWVDRSPCGTGTSARMALLHAKGLLALDEPYLHASLLGTRFEGRLVETTQVGDLPAVVPTIRGRAWISGFNHYVLDPDDPFPAGFLLGERA
jgi:proline racemase